jgi:hypothetical protein
VRLPSPSYRGYAEFVATVLVTIAVLQYSGIFGAFGDIDVVYLVEMSLILPVFTYLLTVALENIAWVSQWDRMVQNER